MAKKKPNPKSETSSFEEAFHKLERIAQQLEEGEIGLDDALKQYEQGVNLLRTCFSILEGAERRIEILSGVDTDGNPISTPISDNERSLDEKPSNRSRRKKVPKPEPPPRGEEGGEAEVDEFGGLF